MPIIMPPEMNKLYNIFIAVIVAKTRMILHVLCATLAATTTFLDMSMSMNITKGVFRQQVVIQKCLV